MKTFRRATERQRRPLAGRRAQTLVAGIALLLTSGLSAEAHAAAKPAHNHFMTFTPTAAMANSNYSAYATLYHNGKSVYYWEKNSISGKKTTKWGFYSENSAAWIEVSVKTRIGFIDVGAGPSTCDYDITIDTASASMKKKNCK